jgi:hypothetical protein
MLITNMEACLGNKMHPKKCLPNKNRLFEHNLVKWAQRAPTV